MSQKLLGTDVHIEAFLSKMVGCQFTFNDAIRIENIDVSDVHHQSCREELKTPDYIDGIKETLRLNLPVRPMVLARTGKTRYRVLDGVNRLEAHKQLKRNQVSAYIVEDATPEQQKYIATTINVWLNGQGLSETDRKRHFLDYLGATSPDLANAAKELRGPLMKRVCHTLAISTGTAKRWTDVEVFKKRAERLGLGLPPEHTSRRLSGEKGDGWILAVAPLTDEELRQYWPVLIGANAPSIRKLEKKLADCTSTRQRAELAAELFSTLHPTLRAITQTKADQDRGKANRIRMHGAGLMKLSLEFAELAKQYPDVGATLVSLYEVLQKFLADSTEDIQHERTA